MSQISGIIDCPNLQSFLNNHFGEDPTLYTEPLVLTEFLGSELNRVGVSQQSLREKVSPGGGKSHIVELVYSPRLSEGDVGSEAGKLGCVADPAAGDITQDYEVGDNNKVGNLQVYLRDLRYTCEENTAYVARKIAQKLNQIERAIETDLFTQLDLQYGRFAADETGVTSNVKSVATRDSDGKFSTDAMTQVPASTRWAGYPGAPILFGGRKWTEYMKEVNAGCCAIDGIDVSNLAAQYGQVFLSSYRADTVFGADRAISVASGAAQLLEWMEYEGMAFADYGSVQQWTIVSPRTGLRYDMKLNIGCDGELNFFIRKFYKLVTMPTDVYYPTDRLYGVNRVNKFHIVNP